MAGLFDSIEKLITEHGSATILKERIALANDKYAALEAEVKKLRFENEELRLDNEQLKQEGRALNEKPSHKSSLSEFTEEAGALFKRRENGEWDHTPYCPSCKTAMVAPGRHELFRCGKKSCGQSTSFKGIGVGDVISRLP
ncbi:hypothetical protein [Polaromonas sp.]|uniref:hypothetical protein n=1 Tax=Polaromonas sp. TaxID=1869339 RepID=UPI002488DCE6|nr:hypothetical protein [Polaromonas sp.]MDI1342050.1 hypothetical protein [Polaromonas sp.]